MRWEKAGPKMALLFFVDMFYSSSRPGVSVLNDRGIHEFAFTSFQGDLEVHRFAGRAFTEAT